MSALILHSGVTGFFNEIGQWQATGSQMGRPNQLPKETGAPIKLRLQKLKMVDSGDYDKWGAYWGSGMGRTFMFCAWKYTPSVVSIMLNFDALVFIRAASRYEAKQLVRKQLPNATFYR